MRTPKAVPVVLRSRGGYVEILVFENPQAGTQIVKGTIEPGESVVEASVRELAEESGLAGAECISDLGTWEQCLPGQIWHFREMSVPGTLPEAWSHYTTDGGGHVFHFRWHSLGDPLPSSCHPIFVAAIEFLQQQLALRENRLVPSAGSGAA